MFAATVAIALILALSAAIRGNWSPCGESLQAQLHPLGERSRGNVWGVTILFFTLGSAAAGSALGVTASVLGAAILSDLAPSLTLALASALALLGGGLDLSPLTPWSPRRQVNENWIGRYRGWVYGAAFGAQLGVGFAVFVMSWSYWAMIALLFLLGSPIVGALVGATFGVGRGILLYLSRSIDSPEQLLRFHASMAELKGQAFLATGTVTAAAGLAALFIAI